MTVQANKRRRRFKNSQYEDLIPEIPKNFAIEVNEDNDETVLTIYGDIGESFWYESTSANDIDRALKEVKTSNITIRLNSPGGDAFDGIAIYNRLKDHKAKVKIIVDGWACSAASIMAMAADELIMNTGAMIMVHEAWTIAIGSKTEMQKTIDMMAKLDESLLDIYMTKAQITRDEMKQFVINETWFTADEAVAIGFATATEDTKDEEADKANAEAYKNNVLARFKQEPIQQPNNVLNKFQRNSTE
ncbi:head maturation protease, ClpP-related [Lysinibacillus parviboronicapiens]|uniref:head maturation protease, ClpP-related n=1 Tax=Lysinibacillus parviboronicapiens TaxID=436516 RepID=UPI000D3C9BCD|nr:head maturation protease, ClpP-related [Lysinibacillus parviboronicapiens]